MAQAELMLFYPEKFPCLRINHRELLRADRSSIPVSRKHITGYHISISLNSFHRSMSDHLKNPARLVHAAARILWPVPDGRRVIPHGIMV